MPGASTEVAPSAMITGATGGIGRAIASRLARTGYRLTLSGRDEAALAKVASDLADSDAELHVVPADMTAEDDVRALARSHAEQFGSMDLLVLSAGTGTSGRIAGYPMRRFDRQISVNVRAPFALVQECLPALRRAAVARPAHGARIAAIASMVGIGIAGLLGGRVRTQARAMGGFQQRARLGQPALHQLPCRCLRAASGGLVRDP